MLLTLQNVSFSYENSQEPILEDVTVHFPTGWTGVVGANGTGKTTLLKIAAGELKPERGFVHSPGSVVYCPQRTDDMPGLLPEFLSADDSDAYELRYRLGVELDWKDRWETLSHGERKRAQIAVALWQQPDVLAVDEPTNHIDSVARKMLAEALRTFKGIGLLVSHDRDLLDSLCRQCLFVEPPGVVMRSGNFTETSAQAAKDRESIRDQYEEVQASFKKIQREAQNRIREASNADRKKYKHGLRRGDSDAREKLDMVRIHGSDGNAGRFASQLEGRVRQAEEKLSDIKVKKEYNLGIWLPGAKSHKNWLFTISDGELELGEGRKLIFPELSMAPDDRIALTGPNGAGKSTLIRHILEHLNIPEERLVYLPQEIDIETSRKIKADVEKLSNQELGQVMTIVRRLGSHPQRLIESPDPSPGEIRKILLALGIARAPHLIIMDEPTNHLDLPAIECLEDALADCPCGLLLVSHDMRFLKKLTRLQWRIEVGADGDTRLVEGG